MSTFLARPNQHTGRSQHLVPLANRLCPVAYWLLRLLLLVRGTREWHWKMVERMTAMQVIFTRSTRGIWG